MGSSHHRIGDPIRFLLVHIVGPPQEQRRTRRDGISLLQDIGEFVRQQPSSRAVSGAYSRGIENNIRTARCRRGH